MGIYNIYTSIYIPDGIDLSQLLYSFWRVGIIKSKLKINYALIKYIPDG